MRVNVKCPSCYHSTRISTEVFISKPFVCPQCGRETDISPYCKAIEDFKNALWKVREFTVKEEIVMEIDPRKLAGR